MIAKKELHNCYVSNCNCALLSNKYNFRDTIDTRRQEINQMVLSLTEHFEPRELHTTSGVTMHILSDNLKEDGDFKTSALLKILHVCGYSLKIVPACRKDK